MELLSQSCIQVGVYLSDDVWKTSMIPRSFYLIVSYHPIVTATDASKGTHNDMGNSVST